MKRNRGFPFEEEEGGADPWSDLAARHPDIAARHPEIAARLRQHPATWARKRRPSSQDAEDFGGFAGFAFEDIPPQFREHLPSSWNRPFSPREAPPPPAPSTPPAPPPPPPRQQSAATQTERAERALPQYGLRNTVDLGQKSPADPSLLAADERGPRSMSAPPETHAAEPAQVRHIPIVVEGRDQPVYSGGPRAEPAFAHHNFPPGARQIPVQHERGAAGPGQPQQHHQPQHHQQQHHQQQQQQQQHQQQQQPQQRPPQQHQQQQQQAPQPPPEQPTSSPAKGPAADPITQILTIQTEVLNLMTEVENFTNTKKDKKYSYLDEMLTRNLIKLDNIETEGKENIRNARKEAIKCIHKCIAVLEAKAETNDAKDQNANVNAENGEAEMNEVGKVAENGALETDEPPGAEVTTEALADEKPQPPVDTRPLGEENTKKPDKKVDTGTKSTKKKQVKATVKDSGNEDNPNKDCKTEGKSGDKEQKDVEAMQVDVKDDKEGDKDDKGKPMDVDGAASQ